MTNKLTTQEIYNKRRDSFFGKSIDSGIILLGQNTRFVKWGTQTYTRFEYQDQSYQFTVLLERKRLIQDLGVLFTEAWSNFPNKNNTNERRLAMDIGFEIILQKIEERIVSEEFQKISNEIGSFLAELKDKDL